MQQLGVTESWCLAEVGAIIPQPFFAEEDLDLPLSHPVSPRAPGSAPVGQKPNPVALQPLWSGEILDQVLPGCTEKP